MFFHYQLIILLAVCCLKNDCDQANPGASLRQEKQPDSTDFSVNSAFQDSESKPSSSDVIKEPSESNLKDDQLERVSTTYVSSEFSSENNNVTHQILVAPQSSYSNEATQTLHSFNNPPEITTNLDTVYHTVTSQVEQKNEHDSRDTQMLMEPRENDYQMLITPQSSYSNEATQTLNSFNNPPEIKTNFDAVDHNSTSQFEQKDEHDSRDPELSMETRESDYENSHFSENIPNQKSADLDSTEEFINSNEENRVEIVETAFKSTNNHQIPALPNVEMNEAAVYDSILPEESGQSSSSMEATQNLHSFSNPSEITTDFDTLDHNETSQVEQKDEHDSRDTEMSMEPRENDHQMLITPQSSYSNEATQTLHSFSDPTEVATNFDAVDHNSTSQVEQKDEHDSRDTEMSMEPRENDHQMLITPQSSYSNEATQTLHSFSDPTEVATNFDAVDHNSTSQVEQKDEHDSRDTEMSMETRENDHQMLITPQSSYSNEATQTLHSFSDPTEVATNFDAVDHNSTSQVEQKDEHDSRDTEMSMETRENDHQMLITPQSSYSNEATQTLHSFSDPTEVATNFDAVDHNSTSQVEQKDEHDSRDTEMSMETRESDYENSHFSENIPNQKSADLDSTEEFIISNEENRVGIVETAFKSTNNHQSPALQNEEMNEAAVFDSILPEESSKESAIDLLIGVLPSFDFSKSHILLLVSLVWISMYYISQSFTTSENSFRKQLCDCQAKLFKVREENNNLVDDLINEREKLKRYIKENSEMKKELHAKNLSLEHFERERNDFDNKISKLEDEKDQQQQYTILREKENEKLKDEMDQIVREKKQLQQQFEEISTKLNQTNKLVEDLRGKCVDIETLRADNEKLSDLLSKAKEQEASLLTSKEKLDESLNLIEELKTKLEKKNQEIESLKLLVEEHLNSDPDHARYSIDEILDSIGIKAELNVVSKQLNGIKEEKNYLSTRLTELELELNKANQDVSCANKAKDDALKELQWLESHFDKKMTGVQSELVSLRMKYDEVSSKNASDSEYLASLERTNQEFQAQIEKFRQELEKNDIQHKKAYLDLQRQNYTLKMAEIATRRDLEAVKQENELLRKRLSLKSQGTSDTSLKAEQFNLDSRPPAPLGFLNEPLDSTERPLSYDSPPPPPPPLPMGAWMNTTDLSATNYGYQTQHYGGSFMPRDTYSPTSHHSHDQRSERSALSHSSINKYQNYGPPPPVLGSVGPLTNPIPSHWYVNQQQSSETYNENRNYYTGGS